MILQSYTSMKMGQFATGIISIVVSFSIILFLWFIVYFKYERVQFPIKNPTTRILEINYTVQENIDFGEIKLEDGIYRKRYQCLN